LCGAAGVIFGKKQRIALHFPRDFGVS